MKKMSKQDMDKIPMRNKDIKKLKISINSKFRYDI